MQKLGFYLVYPILLLIAKLPLSGLYLLSDFLYLVLKLSGYRQKVIEKNLRNSFPEKSDSEIKQIIKKYNHYLCDLILETFKTLIMSEKQAREVCKFNNFELIEKYYKENQSVIILMGHYGNWEWSGPAFTLMKVHQLNVIYKPLSNPYFEKMMVGMRTKFGTMITPMNNTLREMVNLKNKVTATAFISDQTPFPDNAYWMEFLNQETAVFTGFEKLSKKFNYPIFYIQVKRVKRGYYEINPELMFDNPKETGENEICHSFMKRLEKDIIEDPSIWLWSHKRWKHSRKH